MKLGCGTRLVNLSIKRLRPRYVMLLRAWPCRISTSSVYYHVSCASWHVTTCMRQRPDGSAGSAATGCNSPLKIKVECECAAPVGGKDPIAQSNLSIRRREPCELRPEAHQHTAPLGPNDCFWRPVRVDEQPWSPARNRQSRQSSVWPPRALPAASETPSSDGCYTFFMVTRHDDFKIAAPAIVDCQVHVGTTSRLSTSPGTEDPR